MLATYSAGCPSGQIGPRPCDAPDDRFHCSPLAELTSATATLEGDAARIGAGVCDGDPGEAINRRPEEDVWSPYRC